MYLYLITDLKNKKYYVGQTVDYNKRMYEHKKNKGSLIDRTIAELGVDNFKFEILFDNISPEDIDALEEEYIIKYNALQPNGYNVVLHSIGSRGEKNFNASLSEEEAQWILDNRNKTQRELWEECPFKNKISFAQFQVIYRHEEWKHLNTNTEPADNRYFPIGSESNLAKYSDEEIYEIREAYAQGMYFKDAFEKYGHQKNIWSFWQLYNGKGYNNVHMDVYTPENKKKHKPDHSGENNGRAKLTTQDVLIIREMHDNGASNQEIYELYPQVSHNTLRDVMNRKTWKNV